MISEENCSGCQIESCAIKQKLETGVSEMEKMRNGENEKYYNLSGQRVGASYKGIIVKNGRKVIKR